MQNLHRITGAKFQHSKPNLCPFCKHCKAYGEWEGYCEVRNKVLSAPVNEAAKGRCKDFEESK
jgi:hypothetical protein